MAEKELANWMRAQKLKGPSMKDAPVFFRNLEEALDIRRSDHAMYTRFQSAWKSGNAIDFCSNDLLSLGSSGEVRRAFLEELAANPDFSLYSGGARLADGNYDYIEKVEQEIADFHGAETAVMVNSGFEANNAVFSSIPRPGDAIVYDELVHASTHDGMVHSLSLVKVPFRHNDVDSFREVLASIIDSQPLIKRGARSILISVESVYSMDGDVCPIAEMLQIAKEVCPLGNAVFIMDEAHGTGVLGPNGRGLISKLGLEKEIAIRIHTCGKALASSGAVILGSDSVRDTILNYARCVIYTTAPSFPAVAAVRAGYKLLSSGATQKRQDHIQHLVRYFFALLEEDPDWEKASEEDMLYIPIMDDWESRDWQAHIVPLWTRQRYNYWLVFHLQLSGICAFPIDYPTVPKGQGRIRLMFHAGNTEKEVENLASIVCSFAREMISIEEGDIGASKVPVKAQQVYAMMATST